MDSAQGRRSSFHEQWYLVEGLRPALRQDLLVRRHVWGDIWYVLSDPDNNTNYRLAAEAYAFVALLDGRRTVAEAWSLCQKTRGESALTQGEIISLLGSLHQSNLLALTLTADTAALLRRQQRRRLRKLGAALSSFLFLRFPLWYPDAFFTRFQRLGSLPFRPVGIALWFVFLFLAVRALIPEWDLFVSEVRRSLVPSNILWFYAILVLTKICHECAHAFACKYYCARDGCSGDVSRLGIMLLLFVPMPYIDVSSSVQIRSRWRRMMVSMAGVYAELFLAFVATLVWVRTPETGTLHIVAQNVMIVASISTILFNANPLLRFDGYYVLSDLLHMPNLYQRSQRYTVYLIKKYLLGIREAVTVVHKIAEKRFYPVYAVAAFLYRVFITVGIFLVLDEQLHLLGLVLAATLAFLWFVLPLLKGVHYLCTSPETAGRRGRTWARVFGMVSGAGLILFAVPAEDFLVTEGVVESRHMAVVYARTEGVLESFLPTDTVVRAGDELARIDTPGLATRHREAQLETRLSAARLELAFARGDANAAGQAAEQWQAASRNLAIVEEQLKTSRVTAVGPGVWVAPDLLSRHGKWMKKGDRLGVLYDPADVRLRVVVDQFDAARLFAEPVVRAVARPLDLRPLQAKGPHDIPLLGEGNPSPAGRRTLFHRALARQAGGPLAVSPSEEAPEGLQTVSRYFELRFVPQTGDTDRSLYPGQKAEVRLTFGETPLGWQWLRRLKQFFGS